MAPEVKSSILAKLKKLEESVEKLEALRKTPREKFLDNFQIQYLQAAPAVFREFAAAFSDFLEKTARP